MNQKKKKNVIWVLGDQLRGQALSCMGNPNVNTPNIDILAANGVNFVQARSGFPLCCPFRGSMLTSKYPHKCVPGHEYRMEPSSRTIAHVFNENGYDTAYFGKWHLDGYKEKEGRAAFHVVAADARGGFKKWLGYDNNNSQWDSWVHGNIGEGETKFRLDGYESDSLTDLFIDYLNVKAENEESFFAVLSVQPPHDPYVAPAEYMRKHNPRAIKLRDNVAKNKKTEDIARTELAGYYAQIENLDFNLGRIMNALYNNKLMSDTHIIFFSDHGDSHGSQGLFRKTNPYEESVRIPFIIGGAGLKYSPYKVGKCDAMVNHVDISPTTLGLCGIDAPDWMCGCDLSGYRLSSRTVINEPDSQYLQVVIPTGHGNSIEFPWRGVVTKDGWKYICFENAHWLMFNLNDDPLEQVNLAHNSLYKRKRADLLKRLRRWTDDTNDSFKYPQN